MNRFYPLRKPHSIEGAKVPSVLLILPILALLTGAPVLSGQPVNQQARVTNSYQAIVVHQMPSGLDGGGEMALTTAMAGFDSAWAIDRRSRIGIGLKYGIDAYDFSADSTDGPIAQDPWEEIHSIELGLSYFRVLENGWQVFARPSVSSQSESGFDSDALSINLVTGAMTQYSENLRIGLGLVLTSGLEDTRVFPFISIHWKFAEGWTMQNSQPTGPAGPAGLELAYGEENWSIAVGGAVRSKRFRIEGTGVTTDGIAQYESIPLFARYTRQIHQALRLDLYGGVLLGAEFEIEEKNGHGLAGYKDDLDSAPFLAVAISGQF